MKKTELLQDITNIRRKSQENKLEELISALPHTGVMSNIQKYAYGRDVTIRALREF